MARSSRHETSEDFRRGHAQGVAEAEQELREGRPTLQVFGRRDPHIWLDQETGLPLDAIAGCMIDDETEGRAAGHNERVLAHIAAHGLPPSSRKAFEADLFDLAGYVARVAAERRDVAIDGPEATSPDGSVRVRLSRRAERGSSWVLIHMTVVREPPGGEVTTESFLPNGFGGDVSFVPGPRGSDTVIVTGKIRPPPQGHLAHVLFGLRGEPSWLRIEHARRRG